MERREFVKKTIKTAGIIPLSPAIFESFYKKIDFSAERDPEDLLTTLIGLIDQQIPHILTQQEKQEESKWFGGFKNAHDIFIPGHTANIINKLATALTYSKSMYYHTKTLLEVINDAVQFMINVQYPDGTIDLPSTNFHSTPDTAFAVEPLCISYQLLLNENLPETLPIRDRLKEFLLKAGETLSIGGIHTANHRWVVCMALARLNNLFPNKKYRKRIKEWLAENIDIDGDGQYAERSVAIYSPLVNRCLITIARLQEMPELLEYVRKNLDMTPYYLHSNGELVTEASGRQDKYRQATPENYYYAYRYMSILDNSEPYASMCNFIEDGYMDKLSTWVAYMLEDSFVRKNLPGSSVSVPDNYEKEFKSSGLVRIRRINYDATIINNNPVFFTFCNGKTVLQAVRLASAFFGKGQFQSQSMQKEGDTYVLKQNLQGPYFQPLSKKNIREDGDWNSLPGSKREQSEIQYLASVIKIREIEKGFELEVDISGTENVPIAIEFAFRPGGEFEGVISKNDIKDAFLAGESEMVSYANKGDKIEISPVYKEHGWTQLRGALPKLEAACFYMTSYTPFKGVFKITAG